MPPRTYVSKAEVKGNKLKVKEIKDTKNGVGLMPGAKTSSDLIALLFVLLIVTIFVRSGYIFEWSFLNFIFPKALLLLMCGFTKCEVYQEHRSLNFRNRNISFEFQSHSFFSPYSNRQKTSEQQLLILRFPKTFTKEDTYASRMGEYLRNLGRFRKV